jgi:aspartyl-tRNA(Asn)/glutamyl-tRNA(Gln) amidotransferase subunit B
MKKELEAIIGLEVHAQMNTKTKLFCGCSNDAFGKEPNTLVCPICMGHPGTLPAPNKSAVEKAIKASLALKCAVQNSSHMSRKNYFYPDLPTGYQISQYDFPLALKGTVSFSSSDGVKECGITRLHIENDAGKLTHAGTKSLCDYNRAGTPLMEIVTEPDLRSAEDAVSFAQELRRILIAVNSSEADMYKGMMRFDASISLRPKGEKKLYPRTEIKNLNSFKALEKALGYELKRLTELWEKDQAPKGEVTVGWIDDEEKTVMLRDKESAADYRYFPEPDIPPLVFEKSSIDSLGGSAIELPEEIRQRYLSLKLTEAEAQLLIDQPALQHLFDAVQKKTNDAKRTSSLVLTQLMGFLKAQNKSISEAPSIDHLLQLLDAIDKKLITANAAKEVLEEMVSSGKSSSDIIKEKGLTQIQDTGAIEKLVEDAIKANPDAIESWKNGKQAALGAVVGWVMKQSKGSADPVTVNEILMWKLKG